MFGYGPLHMRDTEFSSADCGASPYEKHAAALVWPAGLPPRCCRPAGWYIVYIKHRQIRRSQRQKKKKSRCQCKTPPSEFLFRSLNPTRSFIFQVLFVFFFFSLHFFLPSPLLVCIPLSTPSPWEKKTHLPPPFCFCLC